MWGAIADTVGGDNISKPFVENWGPINPEQVLVSRPDVIIISGTEVGMKQTDAMAMGIDINADEAQRRLKGFTTRKGWENLPAVKTTEFMVFITRLLAHCLIWHQLSLWQRPFILKPSAMLTLKKPTWIFMKNTCQLSLTVPFLSS